MTKSKIELIDIDQIKPNPDNPRTIDKKSLETLTKSIVEFPEMTEVRFVVLNKEMMILGGNMRYKAFKEAGIKEIPAMIVDWPIEKQKRFIIQDNINNGDWDLEKLASDWEKDQIEDWGLEIEWEKEEDEIYTREVGSPIYEPSEKKPDISSLTQTDKLQQLLQEIDQADISEPDKEFLRLAAHRHTVFIYKQIADYYAHSSPKVQELMENSALVIIDFNKAIELGYVRLSKYISDIYDENN